MDYCGDCYYKLENSEAIQNCPVCFSPVTNKLRLQASDEKIREVYLNFLRNQSRDGRKENEIAKSDQ